MLEQGAKDDFTNVCVVSSYYNRTLLRPGMGANLKPSKPGHTVPQCKRSRKSVASNLLCDLAQQRGLNFTPSCLLRVDFVYWLELEFSSLRHPAGRRAIGSRPYDGQVHLYVSIV